MIADLQSIDGSLEALREPFSHFHCQKNSDEEDFFHNKMIDYELRNKARTYLVMDDSRIVAYFSLAIKSIDLQDMSKTSKNKMTAGESSATSYSAYLIGHIAKNDGVTEQLGKTLIDMALERIYLAQKHVGGRIAYLDCKDILPLRRLYEQNGFTYFNTSKQSGLLQYYKKL